MQGYDKERNRLIWKTDDFSGGMNTTDPPRSLRDNECTLLERVNVQGKQVVPGPAAGPVYVESVIADGIYKVLEYIGNYRALVLLGDQGAWKIDFPGVRWNEMWDKDLNDISPTRAFSISGGWVGWGGFTSAEDEYDHPHKWTGGCLQDGTGHKLIVTNERGGIYYWYGASTFLSIEDAPAAQVVAPALGRAVAANIYDYGRAVWMKNRIQWSDEGNCLEWTGPTSGFLDLADEQDTIQEIKATRRQEWFIFRRKSVWFGEPTGQGRNPIGARPLYHHGCVCPNSVRRLPDDSFLFLGREDVHHINRDGGERVGEPIRVQMFQETDKSFLPHNWSWLDNRNHRYYLAMRDFATGGCHSYKVWCYDYKDKHWTHHDLAYLGFMYRWQGGLWNYNYMTFADMGGIYR